MLTVRLWGAITHPPLGDPLFRRLAGLTSGRDLLRATRPSYFWLLALLVMVSFCALRVEVMLAVVLAIHNLFGAALAGSIARRVSSERGSGRLTLLALTPSGPLGLSWGLAAGGLLRNRWFASLNALQPILFGLTASFTLLVSAGGIGWNMLTLGPVIGAGELTLSSLATAASLWLDFMQSTLTASLVALIVAQRDVDQAVARIMAAGVFLAVQVLTYAAVVPGVLLLNALLPAAIGTFAAWVAGLCTLALLREAILRLLWRALLADLNASAGELERLFRRAGRRR